MALSRLWQELSNNLAALAWGTAAGVLAALFTFGWIWRTRDRQIARVGALAQLEASPSLDAETKAVIGERIRDEVFDILRGDSTRRALRVQQTFYLIFSASAAYLLYLAFTQNAWNVWARVAIGTAGALCGLLALGVTAVPSYRWKMPRWLMSYRSIGSGRPDPGYRATKTMLEGLPDGTERESILLVGRLGSPAAAREYVGEEGDVYLMHRSSDSAEWYYNAAQSKRWLNVTVCVGDLDASVLHKVPDWEPVVLGDIRLAIVFDAIAHRQNDGLAAARALYELLALGGVARILLLRGSRGKAMVAIEQVFGPENVLWGTRRNGKVVAATVTRAW